MKKLHRKEREGTDSLFTKKFVPIYCGEDKLSRLKNDIL